MRLADEPYFSILVLCFNVEQYLGEFLQSVFAQTFAGWELVLVDDGSEDTTGSLIDEAQEAYPEKITAIHQKHAGQFVTRMTALDKAQGAYVVFADADDCLRSDALELIFECAAQRPDALIQFKYSIRADFSSVDGPKYPQTVELKDSVLSARDYMLCACESNFNNLWNKAIPAKFAKLGEGYSKYKGVAIGEDVIYLMGVLKQIDAVVALDEVLYFYRQHPSSVMHVFNPNNFHFQKAMCEAIEGTAKRWKDERIEDAVKKKRLILCVESVRYLMSSNYNFSKLHKAVRDICSDPFLRQSLDKRYYSELSWKRRVLVRLIEHKWFFMVAVSVCFERARLSALSS